MTCESVCISVHRNSAVFAVFVCLSVYALTVSVTLSANSPTGQTPQRIFTVDR